MESRVHSSYHLLRTRVAVGSGVPILAEAEIAVGGFVVAAHAAGGPAGPTEALVLGGQRVCGPDAVGPGPGPPRPHRGQAVGAAVALAPQMAQVDRPDRPELHRAALRRARRPVRGRVPPRGRPSASGKLRPGRAAVVLLAAHPGDVAAGEVLPGEALEERRLGAAAQQEEDVVRVGLEVGCPPRLNDEAVATATGGAGEGIAVGHGRVVEGEPPVGVVDVEHAVRAGGEVEHQHPINAEEEVAETHMTAPGAQAKGVVHRDVAAEGAAGAYGNAGEGRDHRREKTEEVEEEDWDHGCRSRSERSKS